MKQLILIRGNSGSGNSTLALQLQQKLGQNMVFLPQDTLRRLILNAKDSYETPTIPLYLTLLEHAYQHHDIVIIEGILHRDWYHLFWEK